MSEKLLGDFLKSRIDGDWINNKKLQGSGINNRPDYRNETYKLIVEFDGYRHYNSYNTIKDDNKKDYIYSNMGYTVVRIPYFVQLDEYVIETLFGNYTKDYTRYNNYPHGFISELALLPVDFNEVGMAKYRNDLNRFNKISHIIEDSYKDKL